MNTGAHYPQPISPGRLWFGFAGPAASWIVMGIADLLITWQVCVGHEQYGGALFKPGYKALYLISTIALLVITLSSGIVSFRNWRMVSRNGDLSHAEGRGREEYMALAGIFMSLTLGVGIIWLGMPVAMIDLCVRAR